MVTKIIEEEGRGERRITRNIIFKVILVVLPIAAAIALIRPVLSDYYSQRISESGRSKIIRASRITGENAYYHYLLGVLYDNIHDKASIRKAIEHYLLSLKRNPLDSQTWLSIAKAYRDSGMGEDAAYAIRKAVYLEKNNPILIWQAGVFFLLEDRPSEAVQLFRRYIYMAPGEQEKVYSLCYMMGVKPGDILDNLIPDDYSFYKRYLNFLIGNRLINESMDVWKRIKTKFNPERSEYLRYCDFLIGSGELKEALALWDDFIKRFDIATKNRPSGEMTWNGDFELPVENGGFDWKIGSSEGVRIFRDRDIKWTGFASLSVNFNGTTNPGVYIAQQVVPVDPGQKYRLTGHIRTEKLTTQNGIVFEVSNYLCDPFIKKTEPVTGTSMWKKIDLEFITPKKCKAVFIKVKREQSEKFDNKISGDAWIDSLSMSQAKTK